jgi:hypothetical protein
MCVRIKLWKWIFFHRRWSSNRRWSAILDGLLVFILRGAFVIAAVDGLNLFGPKNPRGAGSGNNANI